ncbi:MAG: hypothetical protein C0404_14525, partial [Verrucomicrobia bacterium]|nr:hypothetical protein [Verrucomicrobiota bacterium]
MSLKGFNVRRPLILGCFVSCLLVCVTVCQAENLVSRPVGFVLVQAESNRQSLFSMPVEPFDPAIQELFAGQFKANDTIFMWNSEKQAYDKAVKLGGMWYTDTNAVELSTMTLNLGEGFTVRTKTEKLPIYLCGEVP